MLSRLALMLQAAVLDGQCFDPVALYEKTASNLSTMGNF